MQPKRSTIVFKILQWSAAAVLLGRAWQHLYWDAPYRTLFWDQEWMEGPVRWLLGVDWATYATSPATDLFVQWAVWGTGLFYLLGALSAAFIHKAGAAGRTVLYLSSISLLFLAGLYCKEKFFFAGQFFEYTLQFASPALLAWAAARTARLEEAPIRWALAIGIALTFTCHGLYAFGYYPRPGQFVFMTMSILGVDDNTAVLFLIVAGALDFILSAFIFLPAKWARPFVGYAVLWGLATTLARPLAYAQVAAWDTVLLQWLHEAVMRAPHFLLPLALLLIVGQQSPSLSRSLQLSLRPDQP